MDSEVKNTVAYRITRQIIDHTWGSESELSDTEFLYIFSSFGASGGSWEALMDGDMDNIMILEKSIDDYIESRRLRKISSIILSGTVNLIKS